MKKRSLSDIADEISTDWKPMHFTAKPFVQAMSCLESLDEKYGMDTARDIVVRFLCNASTWRGKVARAVKGELNQMLKGK